jgi:glucose-6-phosphate isomerase
MTANQLWNRYQRYLCRVPSLGLTLDVSRMRFDEKFIERMRPGLTAAVQSMEALEKGAIANPDEKRMVGHYSDQAALRAEVYARFVHRHRRLRPRTNVRG